MQRSLATSIQRMRRTRPLAEMQKKDDDALVSFAKALCLSLK